MVHLEDHQAAGGDLLAAVATRHPLARINPTGCGAGAGGAGFTVVFGTVGHGTAAEAVALLVAREAPAHGVAADIDLLARLEGGDGDGATQLEAIDAVHPIFLQVAQHVVARFGQVTLGGLVDELFARLAKAKLDSADVALGVAVAAGIVAAVDGGNFLEKIAKAAVFTGIALKMTQPFGAARDAARQYTELRLSGETGFQVVSKGLQPAFADL